MSEPLEASRPLLGNMSNLEDPPSVVPGLVAVNAIFVPPMLLAVAARTYVASSLVRRMAWDDYISLIAAAASLVFTIQIGISVSIGYGKDWNMAGITPTPVAIRTFESILITLPVIIYFAKLCLLMLYVRLFSKDSKFRIFTYAGIVSLLFLCLAFFGLNVSVVVLCSQWDQPSNNFCSNGSSLATFEDVADFLTAVFVFLLPLPIMVTSLLRGGQRLAFWIMLFLGFLYVAFYSFGATVWSLRLPPKFLTNFPYLRICLISLGRLVYHSIQLDPLSPYRGAVKAIFSTAEINLIILISCLPSLPLFINNFFRLSIPIPQSPSTSSNTSVLISWFGKPHRSVRITTRDISLPCTPAISPLPSPSPLRFTDWGPIRHLGQYPTENAPSYFDLRGIPPPQVPTKGEIAGITTRTSKPQKYEVLRTVSYSIDYSDEPFKGPQRETSVKHM